MTNHEAHTPTPSTRLLPKRVRLYAVAAAAYTAAAVGTALLWDILFHKVPFALFFAAVTAVAWTCGFGPGLLVAVCGAATTAYMMSSPGDIVYAAPLTLLGIAVFICYTMKLRADAERKLHASNLELARERSRLQEVLQQMPVGVILAGPAAGELLLSNKKAEEILRHPFLPAAGVEQYTQYGCFHPDGRPYSPMEYPLARSAVNGERVQNEEVEYLCGDGVRRILEISSAPICDGFGKSSGALAVFADVTQRKHVNQHLVQSQRMEAVGRLAGGVAHDFNNLLTVILGYSDLALSSHSIDEHLKTSLEEIRSCGMRAADLTRQLLAFSRRQLLQPKIIHLNKIVGDLQRMLPRLIPENVDLAIHLGEPLAHVSADPGQIEQVVVNLAVNAKDAMPGGGKLTIETANTYLDQACMEQRAEVVPGSYVMLAVSDTGMGMDSETQARIFEPFFSTKETGKGTGLGLATVYGIVKRAADISGSTASPGEAAPSRSIFRAWTRPKRPRRNPPECCDAAAPKRSSWSKTMPTCGSW